MMIFSCTFTLFFSPDSPLSPPPLGLGSELQCRAGWVALWRRFNWATSSINSTLYLLDINQPPISLGPRTPMLLQTAHFTFCLALHSAALSDKMLFTRYLSNPIWAPELLNQDWLKTGKSSKNRYCTVRLAVMKWNRFWVSEKQNQRKNVLKALKSGNMWYSLLVVNRAYMDMKND